MTITPRCEAPESIAATTVGPCDVGTRRVRVRRVGACTPTELGPLTPKSKSSSSKFII